jgi:hypothetical protein
MSSTGPFSDLPFIGPIDNCIPLKQRVAQLSEQLSSIRITNSDQRADLNSLFDELKQIKSAFDTLANDIKDINSMKTLYTDFIQFKLRSHEEYNQFQQSINTILQSINNNCLAIQQNSAQIIELARQTTRTTQEVPELQYTHFTGNPRETKHQGRIYGTGMPVPLHVFLLEPGANDPMCQFPMNLK